MNAGTISWDIALALASTLLGTTLGVVASNPDLLPALLRTRKDEWGGSWWSVWQDTEALDVWNIDRGLFYKGFGVLKFKTDTSALPRNWEASGTLDDTWYCGQWRSLRDLSTARGAFMFRRSTLKGDIAGYFLTPNNRSSLIVIRALFTRDPEFVKELTAAGSVDAARANQAFKQLIKQ